MKDRLLKAWIRNDFSELKLIALELNEIENSSEGLVIEGLSCSIQGKFAEAIKLYNSVEKVTDLYIEFLRRVDLRYCLTKLNRQSVRINKLQRVREIVQLLFLNPDPIKASLIHHALYTWYITAFWYDHSESLLAGTALTVVGIIYRKRDSLVHGVFLVGHLANVKGLPSIGVPLVCWAFRGRECIQPWLRTCFFSYMAYGLYMVGSQSPIITEILLEADKNLKLHQDPFYEVLNYVTVLRFSSQVGNIETSERVASRLIEISSQSKSMRFYFSSKADLALCYGIRGIYWKCDEHLLELEKYDSAKADPVEQGSFYRVRGWANFFVGKYEEALADSERAIQAFSVSKSFYTAREISRVLKLVSTFRIHLKASSSLSQSMLLATRHEIKLKKLLRKYRANDVLLKMVQEEQVSFRISFSRFWQPGYSRDADVISCQRRLHLETAEIVSTSNDQDAWAIVDSVLGAPLRIRFVGLQNIEGRAKFEVRSSWASESPIEMAIDRDNLEIPSHDMITFQVLERGELASLIDALHTLHPTISCIFRIRDQHRKILSSAQDHAIGVIASQVAHDIQSPLAALDVVAHYSTELPEDGRNMVRGAVSRIRDITNNLLAMNRLNLNAFAANTITSASILNEFIPAIIEPLITEKRMQFREKIGLFLDFRIDFTGYRFFAAVNAGELKRVLSNLINNAVESLEGSGTVLIELSGAREELQIKIIDNGRGIPASVLNKLGRRGFTFGKVGGSGLGLHHALTTLEFWGGSLFVESVEKQGTVVTLSVPYSETPEWFVLQLELESNSTVVVLDDDSSILKLWERRMDCSQIKERRIKTLYFSKPFEIRNWVKANNDTSVQFLLDYELADYKETGLSLIEELGIQRQSILVTSRYEKREILDNCIKKNIKLIPKSMAGFVPIVIEGENNILSERQAITLAISLDQL